MSEVHTIPTDDFREHIESSDCWCKPRENDPGHWVHNSMDRREEYEQGRPLQ